MRLSVHAASVPSSMPRKRRSQCQWLRRWRNRWDVARGCLAVREDVPQVESHSEATWKVCTHFWRTPGLPIFEPMAEPRRKKRAARRSHFRDRLQCFSQWWAPKTGPVFLSRVPPIRARRPPYGSGATTPRHLWYILRRRDTLGEQCPAA